MPQLIEGQSQDRSIDRRHPFNSPPSGGTGQLNVDEPKTGMRLRASVGKVRETLGTEIKGLVFERA